MEETIDERLDQLEEDALNALRGLAMNTIAIQALGKLLIQKGVITAEELDRANKSVPATLKELMDADKD